MCFDRRRLTRVYVFECKRGACPCIGLALKIGVDCDIINTDIAKKARRGELQIAVTVQCYEVSISTAWWHY